MAEVENSGENAVPEGAADAPTADGAAAPLPPVEDTALKDRAAARLRQQITNDRTNAGLSYLVTVAFVLTIFLVATCDIDDRSNSVLHILLGVMGTGWASVISFYFGSSIGSKEKNPIIEDTISTSAAGKRGS